MATLVNPATLGLGVLQSGLSLYGLSKIGAQTPYTVSPEMQGAYDRAEGMAQQGFTGAEKASFAQDLARQNRLKLQRGLDLSGGNFAGAINAAANSTNTTALNQFASSDAAVKRQNIKYSDALAQALQHQKNLQVQNLNRERELKMNAYGGALKMGLENIVNPLNATAAFNYGKNNPSGGAAASGSVYPDAGAGDVTKINTTVDPTIQSSSTMSRGLSIPSYYYNSIQTSPGNVNPPQYDPNKPFG